MRKWLAFLIIIMIMTLSLSPINTFALDSGLSYIDGNLAVSDNSILFESGLVKERYGTSSYAPNSDYWFVDGTDLIIPFTRDVRSGYTFYLTLENAEWVFQNDIQTNLSTFNKVYGSLINGIYTRNTDGLGSFTGEDIDQPKTVINSTTYSEGQYSLTFSPTDGRVAALTVLQDYDLSESIILRVPLVTFIKDSSKIVFVTVDPGSSATVWSYRHAFVIPSGMISYAEARFGIDENIRIRNRSIIDDPDVLLGDIEIRELFLGVFRPNTIIKLLLPKGYYFENNWDNDWGIDPHNYSNHYVAVGIFGGIGWGNGGDGLGTYTSNVNNLGGKNYSIQYHNGNNEIWIYLGDLRPSEAISQYGWNAHKIYINNLMIQANDNAPVPIDSDVLEMMMHIKIDPSISEQNVLIPTRAEYERAKQEVWAPKRIYILSPTTPPATIETPAAATPTEEMPALNERVTAADALHELGLFTGTGTDMNGNPTYELDKKLTRLEALALVIRFLGQEKEAMSFTESDPFTDVPAWGDRYAAYGFRAGITAGINESHTLFGPERQVTFQEFTAFMLRALGYSEADGDFIYEDAIRKASDIGMFSRYNLMAISTGDFLRGNAVMQMTDVLLTCPKGSGEFLIYGLADKGAFPKTDAYWFVSIKS